MIRAATADDLVQLVALEQELFGGDAWQRGQLESELTGPGRQFWVNDDEADSDSEGAGLVAYAVSVVVADTADLLRIGVRPDRHRAGAGTAMLAAAMREAKHARASRMLLEVADDNEAALALYAAAGFTEIDRRVRYYRSGADALVLARDL